MLNEVLRLIKNVDKCAILTGAGISAESGVPTFRGQEGLWGKFSPEELATMDAFMANPKIVWEWYNWRRELLGRVKPNPGHYALVKLKRFFSDYTLITQNVDGLHQLAGAEEILELHGSIMRNKCVDCESPFVTETEIDPDAIPTCQKCGGQIRPDIVWFGEMLPQETIALAFDKAESCEIFFSVGTSALVHPAASLPLTAKQCGATLVEVNPEETPLTAIADFHLKGASGEILPKLAEMLELDRSDQVEG